MPPHDRPSPPDENYLAFTDVPWWQTRTTRWTLGILATLLLLGAAGSIPAWRAYKKHRTARYTAEARQYFADGRLSEAYDRARLGLQLRPADPDLLRVTARILGASGSPAGLQAWQNVIAHPWATEDDRLEFAEAALALDQPQFVRPVLDRFLAAPQPQPRTLLLAVRYHLRIQDLPGALAQARDLVRSDPTNPTNLLTLANLLETRTEPGAATEARDLLTKVASGNSPRRLDALEALINRPTATREDRETALRLLTANPAQDAPLRTQVLLAEAAMRLDPSRTRAIALETLPKLKPGSDEDLLGVVAWLHRHQLFDRSLTLLTPNRVQSRLDLFRARITALLGAGQTAVAYRESLRDSPAFDPVEIELTRFTLATMLGDADAAHGHQERCLRTAAGHPARLRRVAEFASTAGLHELAIAAWKPLANDRIEAARATRALAELTDASGDTWAARDYARRLAKLEPNNAQLQLQIAHYDLLLNEGIPQALTVAEGLLTRPEFRNSARLIAAYACLLLNERERARNHVAKLDVPGLRLPTHLRALHATLLGAVGDLAGARTLANSLPLAKLRPEERELIRSYITPTP